MEKKFDGLLLCTYLKALPIWYVYVMKCITYTRTGNLCFTDLSEFHFYFFDLTLKIFITRM